MPPDDPGGGLGSFTRNVPDPTRTCSRPADWTGSISRRIGIVHPISQEGGGTRLIGDDTFVFITRENPMNRRTFIASSAGVAAAIASSSRSLARQATPGLADLPRLAVTLTDTGFDIPGTIPAGRTQLSVTNAGTMTESHWAMGKYPDGVTEAEIEEFENADDGTEALSFDDIAFVGVPDWPQPGGAAVTGIVDLQPGRYFAFDPISGRTPVRFVVEGDLAVSAEPAADLTVTLKDMAIDLPEAAFTASAVRWRIENTGGIHHDVAVMPVAPEFTADHLMTLLSLPFDATPPPDAPTFEYLPVAAIGILAPQSTSWLDVQLVPGRYLAVCMLPFVTGYPHAMDGMYVFFDVA